MPETPSNDPSGSSSQPGELPPPYQPPSEDVLEHIQSEQQQAGETAAFLTALSGRRNNNESRLRDTNTRNNINTNSADNTNNSNNTNSSHSTSYDSPYPDPSSDDEIDSLLVSEEEEEDDDDQLHSARPHRANSQDSQHRRHMEEFDILDPEANIVIPRGPSFTSRASMASQRLAQSVNNKIITPVYRMLDPVAQFINHLSLRFDNLISKFGNPLILKRLLYLFFVFLIIYVSFESGLLPGGGRNGFGSGYTDRESLKQFLRKSIRQDLIKERVEYLSSMPHQAGTAGDLTLAKYIEEQFKSYSLSPVEMAEHQAFISYPNQTADSTIFELLDGDKVVYKASLVEDSAYDSNDQSKKQPSPYHAFSASKSVEGPVIYVNYGTQQDFEHLKSQGVNLEGAIVIAKMGKLELGLKAKLAQRYNVAGMVTISEYKESGWPDGPGYPDGGVERGSAVVSSLIPGDILTPGWSSVGGRKVADTEKINSIAHIPIIPVSWKDAQPFLKALKGHGSEVKEWSNGHPGFEEWWSGDQNSPRARLANNVVNKDRHAIWNVFGKLGGAEQGEIAIVFGAKRDSFCYGAVESATGTAVLLELARIVSAMHSKLDWVPLRSVYFASWDASNHNMAGSTEWVEYNIDELRRNGGVYISLDELVYGQEFSATGHPMFQQAIEQVLQEVRDPVTNNTLIGQWNKKITPFTAAGDHLAFQSYAGIASLELGFKGRAGYPKNSCFDTFEWLQKYGDTDDFGYHGAITNILVTLLMKLADDPVVPLDVTSYVQSLGWYVDDLERYGKSKDNYRDGMLNYGPLRESINLLRRTSDKFTGWYNGWVRTVEASGEPPVFSVHRWAWNSHLVSLDKHMLDSKGVPHREWFKHVVFGPQLWHPTQGEPFLWGTFPAVRDFIEQGDWERAQAAIERVSAVLKISANRLPI